MCKTKGAVNEGRTNMIDLSDKIISKLKNNIEFTPEEMIYYKKFDVKYWEKQVNFYICNV